MSSPSTTREQYISDRMLTGDRDTYFPIRLPIRFPIYRNFRYDIKHLLDVLIVRLQTRNRRNDHGTENFRGFVYVLDGFPQRDFVLRVFMCSINFTSTLVFSFVSLFRLPRRGLPYIPHGLSRHSIFLLLGYHTRAITLHHTRKSGYHTRHSS